MHLNINFQSKTSLLVLSATLFALGAMNLALGTPINTVVGMALIAFSFMRLVAWVDVWCFKALMNLRCGPQPERPAPQEVAHNNLRDLLKIVRGCINEHEAFATKCHAWRESEEGRAAFRPLGGIRGYLKARKECRACV